MTIHYTPNYGLAYLDADTALVDLAAASQTLAERADAALTAGGVAPPGAADLVALSGRVTTLEQRRPRVSVKTGTFSPASGTLTPVAFASRSTLSTASMWTASPNPTRLVAPTTGEYDLSVAVPWATGTGQRAIGYAINGGTFTYLENVTAPAGGFSGEQTALKRSIELTAGQYIELSVLQNSGAALAANNTSAVLSLVG